MSSYSKSVTEYCTWIAIKGYDTDEGVFALDSDSNYYLCKCTFTNNSVTFARYNSNFIFYNYKPLIVAFGS